MPQSIASGQPWPISRAQNPNITQFHGSAGSPPSRSTLPEYPRMQLAYVGAGLQPGNPHHSQMEHDFRVHYLRMKNITLSADEQLIEQARLLAKSRHKTLNALFREWLEQLTAQDGGTQEYDSLMKRLKHVQAGRRFTRDEMNER